MRYARKSRNLGLTVRISLRKELSSPIAGKLRRNNRVHPQPQLRLTNLLKSNHKSKPKRK